MDVHVHKAGDSNQACTRLQETAASSQASGCKPGIHLGAAMGMPTCGIKLGE